MNEVSKFIGIPYESHGRSYHGSDCWGIIYLFYRDIFGIEIPKYDVGYKDAYDINSVGETIKSHVNEWKEVKSGLFGDAILFKIAGKTVHAGVYLNESEFLHSLSGQDSCICRLDSITWSRRIAGIYRWPRNIQG